MREHLVSIIENGNNVEFFPNTIVPCNLPEPSIRFRPVFCYCRQADDGSDMYQYSRYVFYESIWTFFIGSIIKSHFELQT
jgi:hypothetical protein